MDTLSELLEQAYRDDIEAGVDPLDAGMQIDMTQLCPACHGLGLDHVFIPEPIRLEEIA